MRAGRMRDLPGRGATERARRVETTDLEVPVRGYVCVVSKRHVVEPFDLPADDRVEFWLDAMAVARRVAEVMQPIKMNYEIHGNTLPHLRMRLYPRTPGDPFVGRPLNRAEVHGRWDDDELDDVRVGVADALRARKPDSSTSSDQTAACVQSHARHRFNRR